MQQPQGPFKSSCRRRRCRCHAHAAPRGAAADAVDLAQLSLTQIFPVAWLPCPDVGWVAIQPCQLPRTPRRRHRRATRPGEMRSMLYADTSGASIQRPLLRSCTPSSALPHLNWHPGRCRVAFPSHQIGIGTRPAAPGRYCGIDAPHHALHTTLPVDQALSAEALVAPCPAGKGAASWRGSSCARHRPDTAIKRRR